MNIRTFAYLAKDYFLNSNSFNKNTNSLESEFKNGFSKQKLKLDNIVQYSLEHTEYYKLYSKFSSHKDFPVLDKRIISEKYDSFISSEFKDDLDKLHKVTTSGSYGTPFTFYLNDEKRNKVISEVYFFGRKSSFNLGVQHAYFIAKKKSKLSQFIQNQLVVTVEKLDDSWCKAAIRALKKHNIKILVGYPSAITRLAHYMLENKVSIPMRGIITISEVLTGEMRDKITQAFSCSPVSRYSTEEFGVLANQDISGKYFHLNQCNYFIEILKLDSDHPAEVGELGRVIVTDLFNKSMPLIRYDTGDLAEPYEIVNSIVTKILSVEGRVLAVIRNVEGEVISSFSINGALRNFKNIIQFQFSQDAVDKYTLKIVKSGDLQEEEIKTLYKNILGKNAEINIVYVDDIPPQASGKRPYILQNFY